MMFVQCPLKQQSMGLTELLLGSNESVAENTETSTGNIQ